MKLNPEYFHPGKHHVCMFCSTPLAKVVGGRHYNLGSKTHVLLLKTRPGVYIINCCASCAQVLDFNDQKLLNKIHKNILDSKDFIDRVSGRNEIQIKKRREMDNQDKPVSGHHRIERNPAERQKLVDQLAKKRDK